MIQQLLNAFYLLGLLATLPYWIYRSLTTGRYRRGLGQKLLGTAPRFSPGRTTVWFHAVSVGEVKLLRPLLERMRAERPDLRPVLSTTTDTGYELAASQYPWLDRFYAPIDFTWSVGRAFDRIGPAALVLVELELWPNLLLEAKRRDVPVMAINVRMSERSFRGYRAATPLLRPALSAVRWWGVQTAIYAERVNRLIGPGAGVVAVTGSMKYEGACCDRNHPQTAELRRLFGLTPDDIVWVAGSTQPGEDEVVLEAMQVLRKEFPALRLILVPRHPERFDAAAGLIEQKELEFVRRSDLGDGFRQGAAVALVDSVGELGAVWGLADFAFVGGSLSGRRGGQSMIEPAAYGVATCFGPETWNFQDTVDRLREVDGAVQLRQASELLPTLCGWLHDRDAARRIGENARQFIASQQGAVAATLEGVYRCLSEENATRTRLSA